MVEKIADVVIRLRPESEIRGTVVGDDGKPRAGVRVWLAVELRCGRWSQYRNEASCWTDSRVDCFRGP